MQNSITGGDCQFVVKRLLVQTFPDGVRSRRTRRLRDQLWRADAGSWQIADRYYTASSAARVVAVFDFRVRFVVEL